MLHSTLPRIWSYVVLIVAIHLLAVSTASAAQQVRDLIVIEELRIGSVDEPDQSLTRIGAAILGPDGRIYVSQPQELAVKIFDRSGELVGQIGRRGRGPGELEALHSIGFIGDTLYVTDPQLRRVSYFGRDGAVIRTEDLTTPLIVMGPRQVYSPSIPTMLLGDGSALVWPSVSVAWLAAGKDRIPLWRYRPSNGTLDTIAIVEHSAPHAIVVHQGRRIGVPKPFPDWPISAFLADGTGVLVVRRTASSSRELATFQVVSINLTGDTVFVRNIEYRPHPVTRILAAEAVASIQSSLARRLPNPPGVDRIRDDLEQGNHIPEFLPPVTETASGLDGTIWIKREAVGEEVARWQVIDKMGNLVAAIQLDSRESITFVSGSTIITTERDALDVPYVTLYRVLR